MVGERIHRRAVIFVHAGSSQGELSEIGFADDVHVASPGRAQAARVAHRRPICPSHILRSCGRHFSLHVDVVFNSEAQFPLTAGGPIFDESVIASGARPGAKARHRAALETNRQEQPQKKDAGQNQPALLSYACPRIFPGRCPAPAHPL
jgi:hypothetical protein